MTDDSYLFFNRVVDFSGKDANNNVTGIFGYNTKPNVNYNGIHIRSPKVDPS